MLLRMGGRRWGKPESTLLQLMFSAIYFHLIYFISLGAATSLGRSSTKK